MSTGPDVLRTVMSETGTTQSELSRLSGVHQPSISQFLSGRVHMSDDMLERLMSCLGYGLEVTRRPVKPDWRTSPERLWRLHRHLTPRLSPESLDLWRSTILGNVQQLRRTVRGQPHERNLDRWLELVNGSDVSGLRRIMTGLDQDSIEMREVSPMGGLLSQEERSEALVG